MRKRAAWWVLTIDDVEDFVERCVYHGKNVFKDVLTLRRDQYIQIPRNLVGNVMLTSE